MFATSGGSGGRNLVEIWEVATGRLLQSIRRDSEINSIAFAPDGKTLGLGVGSWLAKETLLELWDIKTQKIQKQFKGHRFNIISIAFSKDGRQIASGDSEGNCKLWDIETQKAIRSFGSQHPFNRSNISPDARFAAVTMNEGEVYLYSVGTGKRIVALPKSMHRFRQVAFQKDGSTLCLSTDQGEIHFLDVHTGAWRGALTSMWSGNSGLALSNKGDLLSIAHGFGTTLLWNRATLSFLGQLGTYSQSILSTAFSPSDALLVVAGNVKDSGLIEIWNPRTQKRIRSLQGHKKLVTKVAFGAKEDTLYSLGYDSRFIVWNTQTGQIRKEISTKGADNDFDIDRAERVVVLNEYTSEVKSYDLRTGKPLHIYDTDDQVQEAAISPDGKIVGATDSKGRVWLWEAASGKELHCISDVIQHEGIRFSPNGTTFATLDRDGFAALWDVKKGCIKARFAVLGRLGAQSEWLTYTPEGYYECSPNAERYFHWSVDGTLYPAQHYRSAFHQPEQVHIALSGTRQSGLYEQQIGQEAKLRRLIQKQVVSLKRLSASTTEEGKKGTNYHGKDAELYKALSSQGVFSKDKALVKRVHKKIKDSIAEGANPNVQGEWGLSPLMFMAWYGDREAVVDLIRRGANVHAVNSGNLTPLLAAATGEHKEIAQLLFERMGDKEALSKALVTNLEGYVISPQTTDILMSMGADPNFRDKENRTPLLHIRISNANPVIKLLLEKGADVNVTDNEGNSPLSNAVGDGDIERVRFLLAHGAKVNSSGKGYSLPLSIAIFRDNLELTRLLLDHGADPNARGGEYNRSTLMGAAMGCHLEIAKMLLDRGARAEEEGSAQDDNRSALTYAVIMKDAEMVRLLISHGANVHIKDKDGTGLIGIAKKYREQANDRFGIIALLKQAGAKE
jgi:WD40 repeat protein/ankyrin repeat protein